MRIILGCWAVVLVAGFAAAGERRAAETREANRPKIWQDAAGQTILKAEQVARMDAQRKLLERVHGLEVRGETSVYDLIQLDKNVEAGLRGILNGMREKCWHYYEDGSCQVEMVVTWREIIERVETVVSECDPCKKVTTQKVKIETRDTDLTMWGSGALPDSPGVRIIQAQRAAEVDAYERLAARVVGIQIDANTTVRDMVLESDEIRGCVAAALRGVEFTDYRVTPKWVEADALLNLVLVIRRIERTYEEVVVRKRWRRDRIETQSFEKILETLKNEQFKETGKAAFDERSESDIRVIPGSAEPVGFHTERTVIERIIGGTVPKGDSKE